MEAYFDNSATTRCYSKVAEIVVKTMTEDFGNPSAMHLKGVEAEKYVREAAQTRVTRRPGLSEPPRTLSILPLAEQSQIIWPCLAERMQIKEAETILSPPQWSMQL